MRFADRLPPPIRTLGAWVGCLICYPTLFLAIALCAIPVAVMLGIEALSGKDPRWWNAGVHQGRYTRHE